MAKPLPPFSGDSPTCPKCSHTDAFTEYKPGREPRSGEASGIGRPERLERRCARCDFIWDEQINPPQQRDAAHVEITVQADPSHVTEAIRDIRRHGGPPRR